MRTETIIIVLLLGALAFGSTASASTPVVKTEPKPAVAANPAGDTFSQVMAAITAAAGAVTAGVNAASQRN